MIPKQKGNIADSTKDDSIEDMSTIGTDALGTRVTNLESQLLSLEVTIKELTPSDDLEVVKRSLNQVIRAINNLF